MNGYRRSRLALHTVVVFCALLVLAGSAKEKVKKSGGRLSYNQSALIPPHRWGQISYSLRNPASVPATVKLRLSPIDQRNVTIFELGQKIGPGMRLQNRKLVTVGSVQEHAVDVFQDGEQLTKVGEREQTNHLARFSDKYIIFLNDDADVGRGLFNGIPEYGGQFVNAGSSARYMNQHWAGYDSAHAVVVLRPDHQRLCNRQYRALLTYVGRGGTLIFADPKGAMEAWQSPLGKCMPAIPLRIRTVEQIPEFAELGSAPVEFDEPINFLEMQPLRGMSTVKHEGFPLVHWGKYGLGYVGMTAIRPNDRQLPHNSFILFYRHLLRYGGRCPYITSSTNPALTRAADKLSGIEIPSAGLVHASIAGYILLVLVVIVIGATRKSLAKAWAIVALCALAATIGVFSYAAYLRRGLPEKSASILEFRNYGCAELCREQIVSLMLKHERTIDLPSDNPDLVLRATPPPSDLDGLKLLLQRSRRAKANSAQKEQSNKNAGKKKHRGTTSTKSTKKKPRQYGKQQHGEKETFQDPLWVTVEDGFSSLRRLTLRDSKPQFVNTLGIVDTRGYMKLPELSWKSGMPEIPSWDIPGEIPVDQAVLICQDGFFPLNVKGDTLSCSAARPPAPRNSDPGVSAVRRFLTLSATPAPMIAIFSSYRTGKDANNFLPSDFRVNGRIITFVPVSEDLTDAEVTILPQRIRVEGSPYNHHIMRAHGVWIAEGTMAERDPILLTARLPLGYERVQPRQIIVEFDGENPGGNINFKLYLYPMGEKEGKILLERNEDGKILIDASKIKKRLIHPADGSIVIGLEVREKRRIVDQVARTRLNRWRVRNVRVTVTGTLPKQHHGRL